MGEKEKEREIIQNLLKEREPAESWMQTVKAGKKSAFDMEILSPWKWVEVTIFSVLTDKVNVKLSWETYAILKARIAMFVHMRVYFEFFLCNIPQRWWNVSHLRDPLTKRSVLNYWMTWRMNKVPILSARILTGERLFL